MSGRTALGATARGWLKLPWGRIRTMYHTNSNWSILPPTSTCTLQAVTTQLCWEQGCRSRTTTFYRAYPACIHWKTYQVGRHYPLSCCTSESSYGCLLGCAFCQHWSSFSWTQLDSHIHGLMLYTNIALLSIHKATTALPLPWYSIAPRCSFFIALDFTRGQSRKLFSWIVPVAEKPVSFTVVRSSNEVKKWSKARVWHWGCSTVVRSCQTTSLPRLSSSPRVECLPVYWVVLHSHQFRVLYCLSDAHTHAHTSTHAQTHTHKHTHTHTLGCV